MIHTDSDNRNGVTSEYPALLQCIQTFSLDQAGSEIPFSRRVARENGWPPDYTRRVIEEYKRFMFLAMVAGHPVTPSDPVDQVWHLHLTYSRSYWEDFCPNVLGKVLHHEPTRGGRAEQQKFYEWYRQTLDSYERLLGHLPPWDIWPAPAIRFGGKEHFVRINEVCFYWVIPKPLGGIGTGTGHREMSAQEPERNVPVDSGTSGACSAATCAGSGCGGCGGCGG